MTTDRQMPQALDAETAVLGSILFDNTCFPLVIGKLSEACFYKGQHREIYGAMLSLYERNSPIDLVTLPEELKRRKTIKQIGGTYFLTELSESVPTASNVEHHAGIILDKYRLRKLIEITGKAATKSFECEAVEEIIDDIQNGIMGLESAKEVSLNDLHLQIIDDVDNHAVEDGFTGIHTGLRDLDKLIGGYQPKELIVIGALQSVGKSSLVVQGLRACADRADHCGIVSLEMDAKSILHRIIAQEQKLSLDALRRRRILFTPDREKYIESHERISYLLSKIFIDDRSRTLSQIKAKAQFWKIRHDIKILFIDYLQIMDIRDGRGTRDQAIGQVTRSLKALAKELDIPIVILSQILKPMRGDKNFKPKIYDLRESSNIQQDADVVILIDRPMEDSGCLSNKAEITVAKNRNGPTGKIWCHYRAESALFEND